MSDYCWEIKKNLIVAFLDALKVTRNQMNENLTVFPLLAPGASIPITSSWARSWLKRPSPLRRWTTRSACRR